MSQGIAPTRLRALGLGVALYALAACAGSAHRAAPPSTDIDEGGFRAIVRTLAGDDFEGRRPGTAGEDKTVAFLVEQFRKLGLKPGNGASYLQAIPLIEIAPSRDASLVIAGPKGVQTLHSTKDVLLWTKRALPEASLRQCGLVFVGYGIAAPEYHWDDYAGADVRGKTVIVMAGDPGRAAKDPEFFRGGAATYYGRSTYKIEEAARRGAAGVLLIHDGGVVEAGWSALVNDAATPQLIAPEPEGGSARPIIEGWLAADGARALFKLAGQDFDALTTAAAHGGFRSIPLGLTADATVHNAIRRLSSANVVALLPGTTHKHEYVLYTAHWDHLGRQPPETGGATFNGAVDDASGVAGLVMLAQSLSRMRPPPERSLVFIAFTAREAGLLGSEYYLEQPLFPLRDTVAALNLDMLYVGGPTRDVMVFGAGNSELDEYLREAALQQGREVRPDPIPEQGLFYRSDSYSFAKAGVPALYARAGLDDSARGPAWGRQRLDDFLSQRYHQSGDQYAADWDLRGTAMDLRLYLDVGSRLARSRRFPRFYGESEFRQDRTP